MRLRIATALTAAACLTLLLVLGLSVSARGVGAEQGGRTALPGARLADGWHGERSPVRVAGLARVTFTRVATLYLPMVFNRWPPCSTVPTLTVPRDGVSLYTIAPLFRWNGGDNPYATSLQLRVSEDPEFFSWTQGLSDPSPRGAESFRFHENLKPDTRYYWRARLLCGEMEGPYSPAWSFRTGAGGTLPLTPTLVAPVSGTTALDPAVELVWEPLSGTVEYLVRYREVTTEARTRWVWTTDTEVVLGVSGGTAYEWWVAARNDYAIGPESERWRFGTSTVSPEASRERKRRGVDIGEGGISIVEP